MHFGGTFDFDVKQERLIEVERELEQPEVWSNPEKAQELGRERVELRSLVNTLNELVHGLDDIAELFQLVVAEQDEAGLDAVIADLARFQQKLEALEFRRMFARKMDPNHAYLDVQAGSGGTEAQDWAEMLLRMYLRFADSIGFKTELMEVSPGDVAGIRSATVRIEGPYAFGWLRTETGVHRLVRKSPFDSGNRRHTSFAAVFVYPEIDDSIEIDINPSDLRTDTYRASGAGGQHVNRTDSAVRITHIPSGIVVQCQSDRSQHRNRDQAMKQLKAKLYELELQKRESEQKALEETKADIGWGHQIRSYVLDDSRVKDLRTGVESSRPNDVLDGALRPFIEAALKSNLD